MFFKQIDMWAYKIVIVVYKSNIKTGTTMNSSKIKKELVRIENRLYI
jgi:hypothetical protein